MSFYRFFSYIFLLVMVSSCVTAKKSTSPSPKSSVDAPHRGKQAQPTRVFQTGLASWYGKRFHGRKTASGEKFNMYEMTAAHKKLPFGTRVQVISETTGKTVTVRINDRGPFTKGRIIDLSQKAAESLGILKKGHDQVRLIILD